MSQLHKVHVKSVCTATAQVMISKCENIIYIKETSTKMAKWPEIIYVIIKYYKNTI